MRKVPGHLTQWYGLGRQSFLKAAAQYRIFSAPASQVMAQMQAMDLEAIEQRVLADLKIMDFAYAAGATLAAVNADPRNHFGKHALRRFDK